MRIAPSRTQGDGRHGFTLVETLIAISVLLLAVVAPMSVANQSLRAAYYARDQITASNLAQEAIEAVREKRDKNVLYLATCADAGAGCEDPPRDIFDGVDVGVDLIVDTKNNSIATCSGTCPALQTDGTLYGYGGSMTETVFTRVVTACYIHTGPDACNTTPSDELRVTVTVTWRTGNYPQRTITISEDLYRWYL